MTPSIHRSDNQIITTELRRTRDTLGRIQGSFVTRVLRTARVNNVEIAMCVINKE